MFQRTTSSRSKCVQIWFRCLGIFVSKDSPDTSFWNWRNEPELKSSAHGQWIMNPRERRKATGIAAVSHTSEKFRQKIMADPLSFPPKKWSNKIAWPADISQGRIEVSRNICTYVLDQFKSINDSKMLDGSSRINVLQSRRHVKLTKKTPL